MTFGQHPHPLLDSAPATAARLQADAVLAAVAALALLLALVTPQPLVLVGLYAGSGAAVVALGGSVRRWLALVLLPVAFFSLPALAWFAWRISPAAALALAGPPALRMLGIVSVTAAITQVLGIMRLLRVAALLKTPPLLLELLELAWAQAVVLQQEVLRCREALELRDAEGPGRRTAWQRQRLLAGQIVQLLVSSRQRARAVQRGRALRLRAPA